MLFSSLVTLFHLKTAYGVLPGETPIKGQIVLKNARFYLKTNSSDSESLLVTDSQTVLERLKCLRAGDSISGTGQIISKSEVLLQTMEYVGLKRLLTTWYNNNEVFSFKDNKSFQYWHYNMGRNLYRGPFSFHYTLSPAGTKFRRCFWKIFIADEREVILGNIFWLREGHIQIDLFDSNTGEIINTKKLIQSM